MLSQSRLDQHLANISEAAPHMMIISTQTPSSTRESNGCTPGMTGKFIEKLTTCGMVYMHRDKKIRDNEKDIFTSHLKPNGWLIITGHGGSNDNIRGLYALRTGATDETPTDTMDITCSADDYVNLVMQSETLKHGDHINVLLYVCYAASRFHSQASFAEQLAESFADRGISTTIIASTDIVYRVTSFEPEPWGDIEDCLLYFRSNFLCIRLLHTTPSETNDASQTEVYASCRPLFITLEKSIAFELDASEMMQAIINAGLSNPTELAQTYAINREKAEDILKGKPNYHLIRKSSIPNAFTVSVGHKDHVIHYIYFCKKNKTGEVKAIEDKKKTLALIKESLASSRSACYTTNDNNDQPGNALNRYM